MVPDVPNFDPEILKSALAPPLLPTIDAVLSRICFALSAFCAFTLIPSTSMSVKNKILILYIINILRIFSFHVIGLSNYSMCFHQPQVRLWAYCPGPVLQCQRLPFGPSVARHGCIL